MGEKTALGWGKRFREYLKPKSLTLAKVAEKMDVATSTVRSWTNGNREPNIGEFLRLCEAAGLDPASVLFAGKVDATKFLLIGAAWNTATQDQRGYMLTVAKGVLSDVDRDRAATGKGFT